MKEYKTLYKENSKEIIIDKSTFIGYAKPIIKEEEALEFIEKIKTKHKDASHNVWAYTVGENMNIQRYSDDGEPQGTAGIPTLEVIKKEDLRNVVIVVTRYFGGVKLGAGGLVRAYTKGAKAGIESAEIIEKVIYNEISIKIDYTLLGKVQNEILNSNYLIKEIIYEEKVHLIVFSKKNLKNFLIERIEEITGARATIEVSKDMFLSEKNKKVLL